MKIKNQIFDRSGFSIFMNLGLYLGISLINKSITRKTYAHIVKEVQDRLASWKMNYISMATKVMLEKLIIETLPTYTMQVVAIPSITLEKIEKYQRAFIWGHEVFDKRKFITSFGIEFAI